VEYFIERNFAGYIGLALLLALLCASLMSIIGFYAYQHSLKADYELTLDAKTYGDSVMIRDLRTDEVTVVHFDSLQTTIDKFNQ
jgi:hypothetical protein